MSGIWVDNYACNACGVCEDTCMTGALIYAPDGQISIGGQTYYNDGYVRIDEFLCIYCGACEEACPEVAIKIEYPPEGGGFGGGEGGEEGGWGGDPFSVWVSSAQFLLTAKNAAYFKSILDAGSLAADIQSLNHSAITALVTATGGTIESNVLQVSKSLSRIAAVSAVYNGLTTIVAFSDGDITSDDWQQLGMTLLNVGGFIPGPIGVICTGINVGMAIYNISNL